MKRNPAFLMVGLLAIPIAANAAIVKAPDSTAPWIGFMNVFELPANGGGFVFGSGWGIPDLTATFDDPNNKVTMTPNTIGDPDPFWYQGGGGPGAPGNKIMEANLFIQVDDNSLAGQTVTFEGTVLSNTYTAAHQASIFIRDFAPDFSSFTETIVPAVPGPFSISLATDPGLGRHVQYGFQSRGENVWITDVAPFGNVVFATPEPASIAMLGLGGLTLLRRRRKA